MVHLFPNFIRQLAVTRQNATRHPQHLLFIFQQEEH
ncbi:Uncharacterised protein [Vibrio cholerae]|nr:Uncharacterised protein [Vibrio cholerae]